MSKNATQQSQEEEVWKTQLNKLMGRYLRKTILKGSTIVVCLGNSNAIVRRIKTTRWFFRQPALRLNNQENLEPGSDSAYTKLDIPHEDALHHDSGKTIFPEKQNRG